jgi:integrase
MQTHRNAGTRRTHGTGSLIAKNGVYYGKWRVGGRQVMRKVGPVRRPATRDGLTKSQAEAQLRKMMGEMAVPPAAERITVQEAAERLLAHLEAMGRKPSTLRAYRSKLRAQINPRIGSRPLGGVRREEIEAFRDGCIRDGLSAKYTANALGFLHSVFEFAVRRDWIAINPCRYVDVPKAVDVDTAIRFLDTPDVEALLRAVPHGPYGRVQRVLYLAAVMTGMRQGEMLALRWQDVDWSAQRVRVNRNYVRGAFGSPKSHRSRSVPLADRLGGELDQLYKASAFQADDDLVFANPHTGRPMNGHTLTRTFQTALRGADVRKVRFHDLRHTFGTRMAAAGVPMRTLQEWMGHRDFRTTLIYADYAPGAHEVDLVNGAFAEHTDLSRRSSTNPSTSLTTNQPN